jgi:hypothetical protein
MTHPGPAGAREPIEWAWGVRHLFEHPGQVSLRIYNPQAERSPGCDRVQWGLTALPHSPCGMHRRHLSQCLVYFLALGGAEAIAS